MWSPEDERELFERKRQRMKGIIGQRRHIRDDYQGLLNFKEQTDQRVRELNMRRGGNMDPNFTFEKERMEGGDLSMQESPFLVRQQTELNFSVNFAGNPADMSFSHSPREPREQDFKLPLVRNFYDMKDQLQDPRFPKTESNSWATLEPHSIYDAPENSILSPDSIRRSALRKSGVALTVINEERADVEIQSNYGLEEFSTEKSHLSESARLEIVSNYLEPRGDRLDSDFDDGLNRDFLERQTKVRTDFEISLKRAFFTNLLLLQQKGVKRKLMQKKHKEFQKRMKSRVLVELKRHAERHNEWISSVRKQSNVALMRRIFNEMKDYHMRKAQGREMVKFFIYKRFTSFKDMIKAQIQGKQNDAIRNNKLRLERRFFEIIRRYSNESKYKKELKATAMNFKLFYRTRKIFDKWKKFAKRGLLDIEEFDDYIPIAVNIREKKQLTSNTGIPLYESKKKMKIALFKE